MTITELREAFAVEDAGWFEAVQIVRLLKDPTPITEQGLRELGFEGNVATEFYIGTLRGWFDEGGEFYLYNCTQYPKTLGKLRCLLLGVGE